MTLLSTKLKFKLADEFIQLYQSLEPDWGYGELGKFTYYRTYSRIKDDGTQESWVDTCRRVVEGSYTLQMNHCISNDLDWNDDKAMLSAEEMFDRMFNMKFLPPGRGLFTMGTDYVMERGSAALYNCYTTDTDNFARDASWAMDMLMCGGGVGFTTSGKGTRLYQPNKNYLDTYTIPDSREGWTESVKLLIESYTKPNQTGIVFDYSLIRPFGAPIKGFGGTSSGPDPLIKLHKRISEYLDGKDVLTERIIVDVFNAIAAAVVAGNVRRSALLAAGSGSEEFLDLKNYEKNPDRVDIGWASNNSILINDGDQVDYESIANRIIDNGEPGIIYLNNIHKYGRIGELDSSDSDAIVVNPCGESAQISKEACNLSEVFPTRCDGIVDFLRTLKFAYLYNKSVTLLDHHDPETNKVIQRNRRIGCSVSGVVEFLSTKGSKDVLEQWLEAGYGYVHNLDKKYSEWLNIPESIRKTVIKPSGTVSILSGVTPGVHYPVADTHIRRVRISNHHPLVEIAGEAGYHIEPDKYSDNTMVISFPVKGKGIPDELTSSIFDKADIATFMAKHWADNAVSVTVKYKADERSMVEEVLRQNEDKWKSVSFLEIDTSAYEQLPYERITEEQYEEMVKDIKPMNFNGFHGDGEMEKFCSNDICEIKVG